MLNCAWILQVVGFRRRTGRPCRRAPSPNLGFPHRSDRTSKLCRRSCPIRPPARTARRVSTIEKPGQCMNAAPGLSVPRVRSSTRARSKSIPLSVTFGTSGLQLGAVPFWSRISAVSETMRDQNVLGRRSSVVGRRSSVVVDGHLRGLFWSHLAVRRRCGPERVRSADGGRVQSELAGDDQVDGAQAGAVEGIGGHVEVAFWRVLFLGVAEAVRR